MRKFTKGLLMTLVASAMSMGAFAQELPAEQGDDVKGYFRVVNLGYAIDQEVGVMHVTAPTTAQPTATPEEALTLAGTVMYIDATPMSENPETDAHYVDVNENDLIVNNLRSQAVDASEAIYGPMVEQMRDAFEIGITGLNGKEWKNALDAADIPGIVDEMFYYMQMFLEPATYEGRETPAYPTYYLKSTTPNLKPLVDALAEKDIEIDSEDLWTLMWKETMQYYQDNKMDQAAAEWNWFVSRIHLGHTYYLIGGRVEYSPEFKDAANIEQKLNSGDSPFISFANNNQDYTYLMPEIEKAGKYAYWMLAPVTTEEENAYFAVKNGVKGLDGHYYTTGYFDFPFEPAEGVKVYGINEVFAPEAFSSTVPADELVAYVLPTEYTGTVPAHTPVVIENTTKEDVAILQPVEKPADEGDPSVMKGIFFDATFDATSADGAADGDGFEYFELPLDKESTFIARENVRVFNKTDNALHKNNPLGFFKYTGETVKANKGWIDMTDIIPTATEEQQEEANVVIVDADTFAALGITEVATAKTSSNVVYDIQGRIVTNPTKGLYIVNGKKVIK